MSASHRLHTVGYCKLLLDLSVQLPLPLPTAPLPVPSCGLKIVQARPKRSTHHVFTLPEVRAMALSLASCLHLSLIPRPNYEAAYSLALNMATALPCPAPLPCPALHHCATLASLPYAALSSSISGWCKLSLAGVGRK